MFHLIPKPLHRVALRLAHRTRHSWRRIVKPRLAGVTVIATNQAGEVLLVRHSYGPDIWSLPGGGRGRSEDPEEAARREIREELAVDIIGLELVSELAETISGAPHVAHIFSCTLAGEPQPDRREIMEARFFALDALPQDISQIASAQIASFRAWLKQR